MFASLVLCASLAAAPEWSATFGPETGSYLDPGHSVAVVAAGGGEEVKDAAAALAAGLRGWGKARLVMTGESLGNVDKLADEQVLAKAKSLPVDQWVVLRVFPGGAGRAPSAVGTVYEKSGTVLQAFSADKGDRLARRASEGSSQGVSSRALDAVEGVARAHAQPEPESEEYDKKYIWFQDGATVDLRTGAVLATWSQPMQGKYQKALATDEFFDIVGHPELSEQYRTRSHVRLGLLLGGLTGILAGTSMSLYAVLNQGPCTQVDALGGFCLAHAQDQSLLIPGLVLGSASLVAMFVGLFISPNTVDGPQAREMAEAYNKRLKSDLHLSQREKAPAIRVAVAAMALKDGGGLRIGLTF